MPRLPGSSFAVPGICGFDFLITFGSCLGMSAEQLQKKEKELADLRRQRIALQHDVAYLQQKFEDGSFSQKDEDLAVDVLVESSEVREKIEDIVAYLSGALEAAGA